MTLPAQDAERHFDERERREQEDAAAHELRVAEQMRAWDEESTTSSEGEMNADLNFDPCFGKAGMENHMW